MSDEMLASALTKAKRLVADLETEASDFHTKPPALPADELAQGETAMNRALASARRMLKALEDAASSGE